MTKKKSKAAKKTKTARKTKPANRRMSAKSERCQPLRDQLEDLDRRISDVQESLGEPDIPKDLRARLERMLRQLITTRERVRRALEACEKIPDDPRR
jgi:hypothetical protein